MFMFFRIERPTTRDLAPVRDRDLGRLLHAVDVRGERRDEDPPRAQRDQLAERLADEPLRAGHPGPLGVRRVAEQEVDAAVADLGEPADVGLQAVDRRVVELPVARVEHAPGGRLDHDRDRSRGSSGPCARTRAGTGRARIAAPPGSASRQLRHGPEAVLVELRLDEAERQPGADHLPDLDLAQDVRQRADVVLVRRA